MAPKPVKEKKASPNCALTATPKQQKTGGAIPQTWAWPLWPAGIMTFVVVATMAVCYALPVRDGDLWWHLSYGHYMVTNHTVIPDHTIYSWTPVVASHIQCAWIGEIVLYLLFTLGGLPLLFILRYACMAMVVLCCALYAHKLKLLRHPVAWFVIFLTSFTIQGASLLKPEIFSCVFMTISAGLWFLIKIRPERWKLCYAFPLIMLIWVNTHGAFIFGASLLFLIALGETINFFFSPSAALPQNTLRHLLIALFLAGIATVATPYGLAYPFQLYKVLTGGGEFLGTVMAYQTIFESTVRPFYKEFLFIAGALLIVLVGMARPLDLAIIGVNGGFALLYPQMLRTTYFWPPIFAFTIIYLLSHAEKLRLPSRRLGHAIAGVCLCISLVISGRVCFAAVCQPTINQWFGFGNGYFNPEIETEFIKRYIPPQDLGNCYSVGGYLLWALSPDYKVMIDPRYFPFKEWYPEYQKFTHGSNFDDFLKKYPCDVFISHHKNQILNKNFLVSPDWRVAFYGPSSAVFIKQSIAIPDEAAHFSADRFKNLKNFSQALRVFSFALQLSDYGSAQTILDTMKRRFRCPNSKPNVAVCEDYFDASMSLNQGDYAGAISGLEQCRNSGIISNDTLLVKARNLETARLVNQGKSEEALNQARLALGVEPGNLYALFNAGVLEWWLQQKEDPHPQHPETLASLSFAKVPSPQWKTNLRKFLALSVHSENMPSSARSLAKAILEDKYRGAPLIMAPPETDQ